MTRIVSYVHRPKRLPRKKATAAAIVTATNKRDTIIRHRKEANVKAFFNAKPTRLWFTPLDERAPRTSSASMPDAAAIDRPLSTVADHCTPICNGVS